MKTTELNNEEQKEITGGTIGNDGNNNGPLGLGLLDNLLGGDNNNDNGNGSSSNSGSDNNNSDRSSNGSGLLSGILGD